MCPDDFNIYAAKRPGITAKAITTTRWIQVLIEKQKLPFQLQFHGRMI